MCISRHTLKISLDRAILTFTAQPRLLTYLNARQATLGLSVTNKLFH